MRFIAKMKALSVFNQVIANKPSSCTIKVAILFFALIFNISSLTQNVFGANNVKKADVRLLIDISGSMKKNDPKKLRIPALQLVTNLLPQGSKAGVWAFGRYVNMMVKLAPVDANWQDKATKTATKINSAGLYTNIGSVLEKASYGWSRVDNNEKRSMLLLTDGMVDISKDPKVNAKERTRILTEVLPKLKKSGVSIHTIALSKNADHELLKELSSQTDGWYQAVDNAEELQRVFLKIFEQAAERDNLPIKDNLFSVDKSIDEMTVLIFRKDTSESANLISPSGAKYNKSSNKNGLRWFSTATYDLVTLPSPEPGNWKIDANVDPDNRVMVVSKLGLSVAELPNNLLAGEAINYEMMLMEEGQAIENLDFLKLVDAKLIQSKDGQEQKMAMFFDSLNNTFKQSFYTDNFVGELRLNLQVSSPTFERERSHAINIYGSPLISEVKKSADNIQPHKIIMRIRDDIVDANSLNINVIITMPDGKKLYKVIKDTNQPLEISAELTGGDYKVSFKISGKSVLGRDFDVSPQAIEFSIAPTIVDIVETPEKEIKKESAVEKTLEPKKEIENKIKEITESEKSDNEDIKNDETKVELIQEEPEEEGWGEWLYLGLGINLILMILGFFGWRIMKKRNSKNANEMADELSFDDDDDDEK